MLFVLLGTIAIWVGCHNVLHLVGVSTFIGTLVLLLIDVFAIFMGIVSMKFGLTDCEYKAPRFNGIEEMTAIVAREKFKNIDLKLNDEEKIYAYLFVEEVERNWLWRLGIGRKNREFYLVHSRDGTVKIEKDSEPLKPKLYKN